MHGFQRWRNRQNPYTHSACLYTPFPAFQPPEQMESWFRAAPISLSIHAEPFLQHTQLVFKNTSYMECCWPFPLGSLSSSTQDTISYNYCFLVELHTWGCRRRLSRVPWTARRSNLSIPKEINSEDSLEGLPLKLQHFCHLMRRADSLAKTLTLGKIEGGRRRG